MAYNLIGKDFTPPDVLAKVTGKAKYAEDIRADGMVFCRILGSPMPHAKVRGIDDSEAKKVKGFIAILTADEVPSFPPPNGLPCPARKSCVFSAPAFCRSSSSP